VALSLGVAGAVGKPGGLLVQSALVRQNRSVTTETRPEGMAEKARESLASAEGDFAAGRYNSCASRAYFTCFQAALAALLRAGVLSPAESASHIAVSRLFADQLVRRRKLYAAELARVLPELMKDRHAADYSQVPTSISRATSSLRRARQFLSTVLQ
jgi:uncharacterized protein (UPF0332 family)